jgi:hypothetical protein
MQRHMKRLIAAMAVAVTLALGAVQLTATSQASTEQSQQLPADLIACNPGTCGGGG